MRRISTIAICCLPYCLPAQTKKEWWLNEPIALIQTNLRETDDNLDPKELIKAIKNFPANTLLFNFGGIAAHYPTQVSYHYSSAYLPAGKDVAGEVLKEAHASGIRVIARFDFSRARKEVYTAHPEWFYQRKDGGPVLDDNELYNACINGGYYNGKAQEILAEALDRYAVDGVFFNWFGNLRFDYKGNSIGLCHCAACEQKFKAKYGRPVPDEPDREYEEFIAQCAVDVAKKFSELINSRRPGALFMTYITGYTDALVAEADLYKSKPLPQWMYIASDQSNYGRNSNQGKPVFDLVMPYQELKYRFASIAGQTLRVLLYQNLAQGAFPAFVVLGTMDQPDKTALNAVKPVFEWYNKYSKALMNQRNAARVILYNKPGSGRGSDYRGFYRMLSELHIPFKVTGDIENLTTRDVDLVIVPNDSTPAALSSFMEQGGSVLTAGTTKPIFIPGQPVQLWKNTTTAYMRITDSALFPSLAATRVLLCEGEYLELESSSSALTLIPPGQFGPPEKVSALNVITNKPGLILKQMGKGQLAFIPWHIGDLYYKISNDKHRLFISDLIDHLLPGHQRQLVTNAHPLVEITLQRQSGQRRTVVHLVNMTGQSGNTFFDAIPLTNITVRVKGIAKRATFIDGKPLGVTQTLSGYTQFVLPVLNEYATIFLYD